ncbi:MAG TPA: VOC family protein [Actinocatenispora sp.]
MLDHVGVQVADVAASAAFYERVFAPLGIRESVRFPVGESFVVGFAGPDGEKAFWLSPAAGTEARELHVAFRAPDRAAIDAVHEAAVAAGVEVLHAPREWPEYHPGYYAVFLRDLDGHNVEAVHHGAPTG